MTILIPKNCVSTHPTTIKLYQTLYEQLGPDYKIVQHLPSINNDKGSLFWIQWNQQSLFLYLSHSKNDNLLHAQTKNNKLEALLKDPEIIQLLELQKELLPKQLESHKAQLVPFLILFSSLNGEKVNTGLKSLGLYLLGKEYLQEVNLGKLIYKMLGKKYSSAVHNHIRHIFSPETLLNPQKNIELSQLGNQLLDNDQEIAMKMDLALPREKRRIRNYNLTGINGGPSSGKTETLIRRAKLLRQTYPERKILVLTINSSSQKTLKKTYSEHLADDKKTDIFSLYQWCQERLKTHKSLVCINDISSIIQEKISQQLQKHSISISTFFHELDYIHGRVIFYEKDYIKNPQTDQPYKLDREHYSTIWKAVLVLKNELSSEGLALWSELPQLLWDSLQKNPFSNNYDYILVDDSQHFPPIAFELFKKMLKPNSGQLFIAQDPNQGTVNPCKLWKDTGLDLRNHSTRLNKFYNINPYILNATNAFYLNRLPDQTDKHILQDLPISSSRKTPELLHFHSTKDEENRLINEVRSHLKIGKNLKDILIVTMNDEVTYYLSKLFEKTLGIKSDILNENLVQSYQQRNGVGICNITNTQGLSASYVFIYGLQQLFESEKETQIKTKEHKVLVRENTQKLSNAMTRAKKKLTLFITSDSIPKAFLSPHINIPTASSKINADIRFLKTAG